MEPQRRGTFRPGVGGVGSSMSRATGCSVATAERAEAEAEASAREYQARIRPSRTGSSAPHLPPPATQIQDILTQFPITPKPDPDGPAPAQTYSSSPNADAASPPVRGCDPPPSHHPQKESGVPLRQEHGAGSTSSSDKRRRAVTEVVRATRLSAAEHLRYRAIVRRTRLTFESLRISYQRQESWSGACNRNDLRASSKMLSAGLWLHRDVRIVGDIPGVLVGDAFFYRAEICVVGLHTAPQAGIGYIPGKLLDVGEPIATSIVSSGAYIDDEDTGDILVYTGSGGRKRNRLDHHANQTLARGNLALHNSYLYGLEVRVIRGHKISQGRSKVYVYDGLYRVIESTFGPGKSGHDVCKFKLLRITGHGDLPSKAWHTAKVIKDTVDAGMRPPMYISNDLSNGAEVIRIPVCNNLDNDMSPLSFDYIAHPDFPMPPAHTSVKQHWGCHCAVGCSSKCSCVMKNGGGAVYTEDGTLMMGRPVVYECGALCACPMTCENRSTQRGMKHRLEVFRSLETGWGVRTLDLIQPGAFVCEYTGHVVVIDDQRDNGLKEGGNIIDPRRFPERWKEWGDASAVEPDMDRHHFAKVCDPGYVLDVSHKNNVACYISHSCTPNVFVQFVSRGNEDESFPHLMVFATETILPMLELSIDYGIDGELGAI